MTEAGIVDLTNELLTFSIAIGCHAETHSKCSTYSFRGRDLREQFYRPTSHRPTLCGSVSMARLLLSVVFDACGMPKGR